MAFTFPRTDSLELSSQLHRDCSAPALLYSRFLLKGLPLTAPLYQILPFSCILHSWHQIFMNVLSSWLTNRIAYCFYFVNYISLNTWKTLAIFHTKSLLYTNVCWQFSIVLIATYQVCIKQAFFIWDTLSNS